MNMPDPQAFATSWMSQFADPAAWQAWIKMPEAGHKAANPLAPLLKDYGAGIAPAKLEEIRNDYLRKAAQLWQDFMLAKT
ncbi:MAG: class I poly(R)-hydroxyalkanoic acid synthase, partial [Telluria sp.]